MKSKLEQRIDYYSKKENICPICHNVFGKGQEYALAKHLVDEHGETVSKMLKTIKEADKERRLA